VIFPDRASYDLVRRSGVLSRAAVCRLYGIPDSRISDHVEFDPALAIKFNIYRTVPSGSIGDAFSAASNTGLCSASRCRSKTPALFARDFDVEVGTYLFNRRTLSRRGCART
jgi:Domain of unknown function (DUF4387)